MPYTNHGTGFQRTDTSAAAAIEAEKTAPNLRDRVMSVLHDSADPISADEIAARLGKPYGSIRPRLTELRNSGKVEDSGQRGKTQWGKSCILWRAADSKSS
jgi:predicted ArsR family transcriptional regulator